MIDRKLAKQARIFAALGLPSRLLLLDIIRYAEPGGITVMAIVQQMHARGCSLKQPTISRHLRDLLTTRLIDHTHGRSHHYLCLQPDLVDTVRAQVGRHMDALDEIEALCSRPRVERVAR